MSQTIETGRSPRDFTILHPSFPANILSVVTHDNNTNLITALKSHEDLGRLLSTALSKIPSGETIVLDARSIHLTGDVIGALLTHGRGGDRTIVPSPEGFEKLRITRLIDEHGKGRIDAFSWNAETSIPSSFGAVDATRSQALCNAIDDDYEESQQRLLSTLSTPRERISDIREFAEISECDSGVLVRVHRDLAGDSERAALGKLLRDTQLLPLASSCVLDLGAIDISNGLLCGEIITACRWRKGNGASKALEIRIASPHKGRFNSAIGTAVGFTVQTDGA